MVGIKVPPAEYVHLAKLCVVRTSESYRLYSVKSMEGGLIFQGDLYSFHRYIRFKLIVISNWWVDCQC